MAAKIWKFAPSLHKSLIAASKGSARSERWRSTAAVSLQQALGSSPETQVSSLDNGLRVASEDTGGPTTTVGVWINAGSRFENDNNNGAAHFLEHMAFKGTSKRSQPDLELEVESMGAHLTAYTSREHTVFLAKCLSTDVPKALDVLSDVVQNSALRDQEVERERSVILNEMQEMETNLQEVAMDYLHTTAYQSTPLANTTVGSTHNVQSLSASDLQQYKQTFFKAPRTVLAAAGGIDHGELSQLAQKYFGSMSSTYENEIPELATCRFTGSEIRSRDDNLPLAHVAVAVEGPGQGDADNIPLMVAQTVLGSWDRSVSGGVNLASRLAANVSEGNICSSFQSFNISYTGTGLWGAYYVCDSTSVEDMLYNIQGEWMRLCNSVTDFEVDRAKNQLKTQLLGQLGTTATCDDIGQQILFQGQRVSAADLYASIEAVNAKVIKQTCSRYIYDKCPAVSGVGPIEQLPDYNRIRGSMYWLRT